MSVPPRHPPDQPLDTEPLAHTPTATLDTEPLAHSGLTTLTGDQAVGQGPAAPDVRGAYTPRGGSRRPKRGKPADRWDELLDLLPDEITPDMILASEPDNSDQPTPARFRRLRIIRDPHGRIVRHGQGCHGVVVEALVVEDAQRVAIKIYDGGDREAQRKEWELSQVDYGRHVVRSFALHTVAVPAGRPVRMLVMRLVPGPTLSELIKERTPVPKQLQARWLRQGLGALVKLSETTELRDIKPANIGLTSRDLDEAELVLLDHSHGKVSGMSTGPVRGGTIDYAAPEYLFGGSATRRADVFSLGAALLDTFLQGEGFPTRTGQRTDNYLRTCEEAPRLDDPRLDDQVARVLSGALVKRHLDRPAAKTLLSELDNPSAQPRDWDPRTPVQSKGDLLDVTTRPAGAELPIQQDPAAGSPGQATTPPPRHSARDTPEEPRRAAPLGTGTSQRTRAAKPLPAPEAWSGKGRNNLWVRFAGVEPKYVEVYSERVLYSAAGVMLAIYGVYAVAAVTGLYHIVSGVTGSGLWVGAVAGAMVATVVISLDRSIIAAIPTRLDAIDDESVDAAPLGKHRKGAMALRVGFALLFALVIMEPANLLLFGKDVDAAIDRRVTAQLEPEVERIRAEQEVLRAEQRQLIDTATNRIEELEAAPARFNQLAAEEESGRGATGIPGCGPQCEEYLQLEREARASLPAQVASQEAAIAAALGRIDALHDLETAEIAAAERAFAADDGFFAREKALWSLLLEDRHLLVRFALIASLLLAFEMAGVLTKLLAKGNAYEQGSARRQRQSVRRSVLDARAAKQYALREVRYQDEVASWRQQGNLELLWIADEAYYDQHGARVTRDPAPTSLGG